jgi:general secretion pathway protein J
MSRRAGITLIEAMLAITILSMIGTAVYSAFVQTAHNKERIETSLDRHRMVAAALDRMQRELSMAYVSVHVPINPSLVQTRPAFIGRTRGTNSRLDFASFSHQRLFRGAKESDQNEIGYFLARHPEDRARTVLARREQNRVDDEPEKGGKVEVLLEDVSALEFEYLDATTNLWTKSWDTTQLVGQLNRLPMQVKIRIKVPDPANPKRSIRFGTRATLPLVYALNHAAYNP